MDVVTGIPSLFRMPVVLPVGLRVNYVPKVLLVVLRTKEMPMVIPQAIHGFVYMYYHYNLYENRERLKRLKTANTIFSKAYK